MYFWKMHGTGNDFVMVEAQGDERGWPRLAQAMCNRHFGVGADGLILVLPSANADVRMHIFNPDGSEAEMCGNGIRCLVKYAVERGLVVPTEDQVAVETAAGLRTCRIFGEGGRVQQVQVSMGVPQFSPREIPVALEIEPPVKDYPLEVDDQRLAVTCLSMGNPHAVFFSARSPAVFPLEEVGPKVERHPLFPQRVNFEVARVRGRDIMELRVWERGAGPTLACGTGACAAVVAARLHHFVDDQVQVKLPGGSLSITWYGQGEVYMTGSAETVFAGEWPD